MGFSCKCTPISTTYPVEFQRSCRHRWDWLSNSIRPSTHVYTNLDSRLLYNALRIWIYTILRKKLNINVPVCTLTCTHSAFPPKVCNCSKPCKDVSDVQSSMDIPSPVTSTSPSSPCNVPSSGLPRSLRLDTCNFEVVSMLLPLLPARL